jgi:hypothetical protein
MLHKAHKLELLLNYHLIKLRQLRIYIPVKSITIASEKCFIYIIQYSQCNEILIRLFSKY